MYKLVKKSNCHRLFLIIKCCSLDEKEIAEKAIDEKKKALRKIQRSYVSDENISTSDVSETDTEWQKILKDKKNDNYYKNIKHLESDQISKEAKIRQPTLQTPIQGEKIMRPSKDTSKDFER